MDQFKRLENVDICDVCGSRNIATYYQDSDIVICLDCKFLFVSPRPSMDDIKASYSDSSFYDGWISESEGRLQMWNKRFKRISKYLKKSSVILDFSAGIGTFLQIAKEHGHKIYGTELSESAKNIALKIYNIELCDTDYYFRNNYSNYFDIVTAWHVVEHVTSPKSLVSKFYRALHNDGFLIVAVPNSNAKSIKRIFNPQNLEQVFPKLRAGYEIHLSQFTNETLKTLLESVGFHILQIGIDDHFPTPSIKTTVKYYCYELIRRISDKNLSPTIFMVAQK